MNIPLSPEDMTLFEGAGEDAFYKVVWLRHGELVTRSANALLDVPQPKTGDLPNRNRGQLREPFLFPGPGDCVHVGRSISQDLSDFHQFAWWLTAHIRLIRRHLGDIAHPPWIYYGDKYSTSRKHRHSAVATGAALTKDQ